MPAGNTLLCNILSIFGLCQDLQCPLKRNWVQWAPSMFGHGTWHIFRNYENHFFILKCSRTQVHICKMADPWQEAMEHAITVARKAGAVSVQQLQFFTFKVLLFYGLSLFCIIQMRLSHLKVIHSIFIFPCFCMSEVRVLSKCVNQIYFIFCRKYC